MNTSIENIFIINLKKRKDLLEKINYIFDFIRESYSYINIERIDAIDTFELSNRDPNYLSKLIFNGDISLSASGLRKTGREVLGEIGCYLSHKKCWDIIVKKNLNNVLIIEDGVIFNKENFSPIIDDKDYDILYTNKEMKKVNGKLNGYGTQSYILSNKGANNFLNKHKTLFLPIDLQMRNFCNLGEFKFDVFLNWITENNINKNSSISNEIIYQNNLNNQTLNNKQCIENLITRIIKNMIKKNINLVDFL